MMYLRICLWATWLTIALAKFSELDRRALNNSSISAPDLGANWTISSFKDALDATTFALTYGYPLLPVAKFLGAILTPLGSNAIYSIASLSNADSRNVVRPNVDTLYTVAAIDLSQTDLSITLPNITDGRYYVLPFYDIYGDNFANIGSVTKSAPGKYLLRRAEDAQASPGVQVVNLLDGSVGIINFPTTYGFIIGRILLRNNGSDLDTVHSYQSEITLTPTTRAVILNPAPPKLSTDLLNGSLTGSQSEQILQVTARVAPYANPEVEDRITDVQAILATAGIQNGNWSQPSGVNLTEAETLQSQSIESEISNPSNNLNLGNGWGQEVSALSGNFGSNYAARAFIAANGLGQLTADQALYPSYSGESANGELFLEPNQAKLFTFSGRPPLGPGGFWSLTAYGEDQFLIPNPLNVFAIGDRSNLTYPNGTLVYSGITDKDGMFQILVQPADVPPPQNWTSNWLAAPPGGGKFSVNLRWYAPLPAITNGSYAYPLVTNHTAFTASGTPTSSSSSSSSTIQTIPSPTRSTFSSSVNTNAAPRYTRVSSEYWSAMGVLCVLFLMV